MITRLHPLGYPVDIVSDSDAVMTAAKQSWEFWPALFDTRPMRFEIALSRGAGPSRLPHFEAPPGWLTFRANDENRAAFELQSQSGFMLLGESALGGGASTDYVAFRHHWLEALVLTALDSVYFTPLHAACVIHNGVATLLCGDSGAGKSSLAYACARKGWTFISDDAVHLAPGPQRIGVGGSQLIHLRESARGLFPELEQLDARTAPNGKQAIEIDAAATGFLTARFAFVSRCYFLLRRPGPPVVRRFSACAAIQYFLKYLLPRDTSSAERHLREFLSSEPCVLQYEHMDDALAVLAS